MDSINFQIERLKSPDKNVRYDACEELRVALVITQEALDALEQATHDLDPDVADAAKRALTFHTQVDHPVPTNTYSDSLTALKDAIKAEQTPKKTKIWGFVIAIFIIYCIIGYSLLIYFASLMQR
jgi:hypothetical protein